MGLWIAENEGAKFWMGVLNEIKNRGVQDILIACMDGLTGFPEAVRAVYPNTRVQLCIVHMVRNSTKFVSYKDLKKVCADLKAVYSAATEEAGRDALEEFGKTWNTKYPMIYQSWDSHWDDRGLYESEASFSNTRLKSAKRFIRPMRGKRSFP
jgi:transposase-like protein